MMNKQVKAKWLKALRSGKYKQGGAFLRTIETNRFCCLGVLCDIAEQENIVHSKNKLCMNERLGIWGYGKALTVDFLPDEVMEWSGIESNDPELIDPNGDDWDISYLNDELNLSFNDIADLIEAQL